MSGIAALIPPKRVSLDRAAADSLREAIISGAVSPGSRLTEAKLADQFLLSRGTVRAALHRLVAEGLVVQRPYSGWDVVGLSSRDAWELATLRSSLEALAARLAAERIDDSGRATIEAAFATMSQAVTNESTDALISADIAFHCAVVDLSGNGRLRQHYDLILNQLKVYIASSTALLRKSDMIVQRHRELIEPILVGDASAAESAFRLHSTRSGEEIVMYLKQRESTAE